MNISRTCNKYKLTSLSLPSVIFSHWLNVWFCCRSVLPRGSLGAGLVAVRSVVLQRGLGSILASKWFLQWLKFHLGLGQFVKRILGNEMQWSHWIIVYRTFYFASRICNEMLSINCYPQLPLRYGSSPLWLISPSVYPCHVQNSFAICSLWCVNLLRLNFLKLSMFLMLFQTEL